MDVSPEVNFDTWKQNFCTLVSNEGKEGYLNIIFQQTCHSQPARLNFTLQKWINFNHTMGKEFRSLTFPGGVLYALFRNPCYLQYCIQFFSMREFDVQYNFPTS